MSVFSKAVYIKQAFQNVSRLSEIANILAKYGFSEFLHRMHISDYLLSKPKKKNVAGNLSTEKRLKLALEELGPAYVKFGQLLATRTDLIPANYIEELKTLQDNVKPIPFADIETVIRNQSQFVMSELFTSFSEKPLAAASIAQVYEARLISGEEVVVKVQRPGIAKIVKNDISILNGLAVLCEKYIPELKIMNPSGMVSEFVRSINQELNFCIEANNTKRMKESLQRFQKLHIPKIYSEFSSSKLLVQEKLCGTKFSDRDKLLDRGIDVHDLVALGGDVFFHMVLKEGVFHGDLHPGNLFALDDGRLGIIDFGICGRLSKRVRNSVMSLFVALMDEDYEALAHEYLYMSYHTGHCDVSSLTKELMDLISPYMGLTLGEVNVGEVMLNSTYVAAKHNLQVPRELMMLFRALVTIEGLGRSLDPDFDLMLVGNRLAKQAILSQYNKEQVMKEFVIAGREVKELFQNLPRLSKRFIRKWSQDNFAFEVKNNDMRSLAIAMTQLKNTLFSISAAMTLLIAGVTFLSLDQGPYLFGYSLLGLVFTMSSLVFSVVQLVLSKKNI